MIKPAVRFLIVMFFFGKASGAQADRIVLAPQGDALSANSFKAEFALSPYRKDENLIWLQYGSPGGVELELQRWELAGDMKKRYSFNVQYPLLAELSSTPALSVGVRDLFGTGLETGALYVSVGKSLSLSDRLYRLVRELKIHAGFGTGRMDGLFAGVQARLAAGLYLNAEVYRQRANVSIGLPLARNLQAKAYSLDGTVYYGLSYMLAR
jgi:hypothetical protein